MRTLFAMLILGAATVAARAAEISIVIDPDAAPAANVAAKDLGPYLGRTYPADRFTFSAELPASGPCILLGEPLRDARVRERAKVDLLRRPGSFGVSVANEGPRAVAVIAGADGLGVAYGAYALLEKLGCGFYLSYDALPAARREPFSFAGWELADAPLVQDRVVFNWHNFLSGCSTWNLADWQKWTAQARKMRFNGIMVHAYGNNPMVRYSFAGVDKPLGYLSTTRKGRDWSTNHVTDVRRLFGGSVFSSEVFGADAAQVPDEQRGEAAEKLMQQVFAHAKDLGMNVVFCNDVDTISSNPQPLILKLPQSARFPIQNGALWLANPQTPEGNEFYRIQVQALLRAYPQITKLVVWFRTGGTPWMELKLEELPKDWQEEYGKIIAQKPGAAKLWKSVSMFALSKIVMSYDRALREMQRGDIELCIGTWDFKHLPAGDLFMPRKIKFFGLDYAVLHGKSQLDTPEQRRELKSVGEHRPVVPVTWAHHDDGTYFGRPFTPYQQFNSKLAECGASGFGIIHWMTRPLDLYFSSLSQQVWENSKDRQVAETCELIAARSAGEANGKAMGGYLYRWVTESPNFGRETSDFFIDRTLTKIDQTIAGCEDRLKLIETIDQTKLDGPRRDWVKYYTGLEKFIIDFHRAHEAFQQSQDLLKKGDITDSRKAIAACDPAAVIDQFRQSASLGGMTRGEQGLLVSLNLRWLPHIVAHRQRLGIEPIRYRFGPTSHDPLAQSPGWMSFHFGPGHEIWQCLGEKETGAKIFALPESMRLVDRQDLPPGLVEICRTGIDCDKPVTVPLRPIFSKSGRGEQGLRPGQYRLTLVMLDPTSTAVGQRVFDVRARARQGDAPLFAERIDIFKETGRTGAILVRRFPVNLSVSAAPGLTLTPITGSAILCGIVLDPAE